MVNNQTPCVIVKVFADYDYIYNVIDYDYIASINGDYNYLRSSNRLQSIMITPNPDVYMSILLPLKFNAMACNTSHFQPEILNMIHVSGYFMCINLRGCESFTITYLIIKMVARDVTKFADISIRKSIDDPTD